MIDAQSTRAKIEALLHENERLEAIMRSLQQKEEEVRDDEIRTVQRQYMDWYSQAKRAVLPEDQEKFEDMYEGGVFVERIKAYLNAPLEINQFWKPETESPLVPKWRRPFEGIVRESIMTQRQVLINAIHSTADVTKVLDELSSAFRRLPDFLQVLRDSSNPNVPAPTPANEKDLQVLVHALLRVLYSDVRPEDYVPKFAGGGSRTDFLIRDAGVLVETKMTRDGLDDRRVGEELLVDWGRYVRHPDCRGIFALVYDPDRRLANVPALEADLSRESGEPITRVTVVR